MIVIAAAIIGIVLGVLSAKRRDGNRLDMAQYGAGYGIAFAIIGLFVTLLVERMVI